MASEEEQKLFDEIINKGCCQRCALRYLGYCKTLITFDYPETCLANFGLIPPSEEPLPKLQKKNPCSVCLGLLQDAALDKIFEHESLSYVEEYQSQTFMTYITFPTCILIRDHSMKIHLKKLFPTSFDISKVIKMNQAWSYSIKDKLSKKLNKGHDYHSKLIIHFYISYLLEEEEIDVVQKHVNQHLSKHTVFAILESIPDEIFEKLVKVPPRVPLYEVQIQNIKYYSEAIHLIGNYCKYSRTLPLSLHSYCDIPSETSIEKIILDAVKCVLCNYEKAIFTASSFDDPHIRVLGNGRTFHLQISDPKFVNVGRSDCAKIQEKIKETKVLEVKNLREADRRDIKVVIDSECAGTRLYRVLCLVEKCTNVDHCVNAINIFKKATIQQKTPIRLIQEVVKTKRKRIFNIKASKVQGTQNHIELELCTECSFYVQEFINGDFGRTFPSLSDIIKAKVECLAIDIIDFSPSLPCLLEPEQVRL